MSFKEFPVNDEAAHVLSNLSDRLVAHGPHDMEALDIADRWRSNDEKDDKAFSYVRTALVKVIGNYSAEFKELKNHNDLAIRKGYYSNLRFAKSDDVFDGCDKDGREFLNSAMYNDSFFTTEETRSALDRACCEISPMSGLDYFNFRTKYLLTKHPEWFKDSWSGELPFEEIEDADERREKRLEYLNTQVAELHKALLGNKSEYQDSNEFGENVILNDFRLELQKIGEHLSKL